MAAVTRRRTTLHEAAAAARLRRFSSNRRACRTGPSFNGEAMNQLDLRNRRAVVTGGAAGIGLAVADRLAKSGAIVALWDRDERALANASEALDAAVTTHALDVSDHHAVERAAQATAERLGGIDVLVCSAGITGPNTTTWRSEE